MYFAIVYLMKQIPHLAESFGQILQKFREHSGLTQIELAAKIDCSLSYIGFLEHGKKVPTLTTFHLLCEALQVTPHEFIDAYQRIVMSKTGK